MQAKFCSKCGNTLKEGDKFCRKCGAQIRVAAQPAMPSSAATPDNMSNQHIPSYEDVKSRFNNAGNSISNSNVSELRDSREGTVLLSGPSRSLREDASVKRGSITLSMEDMLRGCSKVVDFGTGKRFELVIPPGLSPGDTIVVKNTGITDKDTGVLCDISLTAEMG